MKKTEAFIRRWWNAFTPTTIDLADDLVLAGGKGVWLYDTSGKMYLDFCSQAGVSNIGHHHPFFMKAQRAYLDAIEKNEALWYIIGTDFYFDFSISVNGEKIEASQPALADMLKRHMFGDDTRFIQQVSGTTTNNAAIKCIEKIYPAKKRGFAFKGAFQGRQGNALGCTYSRPIQRQAFAIGGHAIEHLPFVRNEHELWQVKKDLKHIPLHDYAFIIFELIQGEGGVEPANEYTIQLLKHLRENGVLLVCDDIQEGFGRTGTWWSYQNYEIIPDIITISKAMGGGDPIGTAFFNAKNNLLAGWKDALAVGWDSSTFQWNPHAVWNAIITLMIFEREGLVERAREMGPYLQQHIEDAIERFYHYAEPDILFPVSDVFVKGFGMHYGIEFRRFDDRKGEYIPDPLFRNAVYAALRKNGVITLPAGNPEINPTIRFMPPLVITKKEIEAFGSALLTSLKDAYASLYKSKEV